MVPAGDQGSGATPPDTCCMRARSSTTGSTSRETVTQSRSTIEWRPSSAVQRRIQSPQAPLSPNDETRAQV